MGAADEPLRTMILVGIHAGLRLASEALTLRWADVDLRRGLVTVQAAYAKSGKTRAVPLNWALRSTLAALLRRAHDAVESCSPAATGGPSNPSARRSRPPAGPPGSRA